MFVIRKIATPFVVALCAAALLATAAPAQAATFTFHGRGWGHGLGMSQWGARGFADRGRTAAQILRHYYTGTTLEKKSLPSAIRVGVLQDRYEIWLESNGAFDLYDSGGTKRATSTGVGRWRIVPNGTRLDVYAPNATSPSFRSEVPVTARYEHRGTLLHLPQTGYDYKRGRLDVDINPSTGKTRAVVIVPFEQYLYGLGEMPASWPTEALKSQAIAGRTYALEKVTRLGQKRPVCNCGVYASTADQAYVGARHEVSRWVAAVDGTAGTVATYKGAPIQAFYSSSTGGYTEHNENVWGGSPIPYLRGKCDHGDWAGGANPHNAWTVTMSDSEVASKLRSAGYEVGNVVNIGFPSPRGVSGRVISVKSATSGGVLIDGTTADVRMSGAAFRSIMGLKSNLIFHHVEGPIRLKYDALKCAPGLPRAAAFTWRNLDGTVRGKAQRFIQGRLHHNGANGKVFWTTNAFTDYYDLLRDARKLDLGLPTADTKTITGGKMSTYEAGHIYWSPAHGTRVVYGAILAKYLATGGYAKWGFPSTDELGVPGGRSSRFDRARFYWTPTHGAHPVYGAILKRYVELGAENSPLGLPVSDVYSIQAGRRMDFQRGYMTWNRSTGKTYYRLT